MKKFLIIAGGLGLVGFLAWEFVSQAKLLMKYCISFAGYHIHEINRDRITIEILLKITNKSKLAITLTGYDFRVYLNGAYVTKIYSKKEHYIKGEDFTVLSLLIDVEPKKSKALASWDFMSGLLLNVNNIRVKFNGTVSASLGGIGAKNIPVDVEMKLKEMMPDPNEQSEPCV